MNLANGEGWSRKRKRKEKKRRQSNLASRDCFFAGFVFSWKGKRGEEVTSSQVNELSGMGALLEEAKGQVRDRSSWIKSIYVVS